MAIRRLETGPLYHKVREAIFEYVQRGELPPDNRLPSEDTLCSKLGVSRNTVREALLAMEHEGLVTRKRGMGTFIHPSALKAGPRIELVFDFAQLILAAGYSDRSVSHHAYESTADETIAEPLGIKVGDPVHVLEPTYSADGQPVIFCVYSIPHTVTHGNSEIFEARYDSFFSVFKEVTGGAEITHSIAKLKARTAEGKVAEELGLTPGTPIFSWDEILYDLRDRPVLYSKVYFNTERVPLCTMRMVPSSMSPWGETRRPYDEDQ